MMHDCKDSDEVMMMVTVMIRKVMTLMLMIIAMIMITYNRSLKFSRCFRV